MGPCKKVTALALGTETPVMDSLRSAWAVSVRYESCTITSEARNCCIELAIDCAAALSEFECTIVWRFVESAWSPSCRYCSARTSARLALTTPEGMSRCWAWVVWCPASVASAVRSACSCAVDWPLVFCIVRTRFVPSAAEAWAIWPEFVTYEV